MEEKGEKRVEGVRRAENIEGKVDSEMDEGKKSGGVGEGAEGKRQKRRRDKW